MAEYKNGFNYRGNMSVEKEDYAPDVQTGRAVFVDEDKYTNDASYKAKVDKCIEEGFHRVVEGESGGSGSDIPTPTIEDAGKVLAVNDAGQYELSAQGGGGSSDFSTATVTVINNGARQMGIGVAYRQTAPSEAPFQGDYLMTDAYADPNESVTVEAILIDGRAIAYLLQGDIGTQVTVEGNAQVVFGDATLITGDCTITISE